MRSMSIAEIALFVAVAVFVIGWFAIGTQYNLYRGKKALTWLQDGLKLLGERTSLRWLGSAAIEMKIEKASEPFQRAEIVVVLEPRDVAPVWCYYRLRGRRDLLIVRANLRSAPSYECEVLDPKTWSAHGVESKIRFRNWNPVPVAAPSLVVYAAGSTLPATELISTLTADGCQPIRVAIRRTQPNVEIHWELASAQRVPASTLLASLRRIPQLTSKR